MNERIQELAEQAWRATSDEVAHLNRIHNRSYSQDEITDIFEIKFAELIVRECANVVLEWKSEPFPYDPEFGAKLIKEHFEIK